MEKGHKHGFLVRQLAHSRCKLSQLAAGGHASHSAAEAMGAQYCPGIEAGWQVSEAGWKVSVVLHYVPGEETLHLRYLRGP